MEQNEVSGVRFRPEPLIHLYEVQESAADLCLCIAGVVTRREAVNWLQQALYDVDHKHARSVMPARAAGAEQCDAERWRVLKAWGWEDETDQLCAATVATALAQELEIKKGVQIEITTDHIELLARNYPLGQGEGSVEESAAMGLLSPTHCSGGRLHVWPEEDSGISYPCSTCHNMVRRWCTLSECCGVCCGIEQAEEAGEEGLDMSEAALSPTLCANGTSHEGRLTMFDDY